LQTSIAIPVLFARVRSVDFYDSSFATPTKWDWSFTGTTFDTSSRQNPIVTYNTPYSQTVSLTVSDSVGSSTQTQYGYIYVSPSWADYSGTYSEGFENPSEVNDTWLFYNEFNDGVSWQYTNTAAYAGTSSLMLNSWQHAIYDNQYSPPLEEVPPVGPYAVWAAITPAIDLSTTTAMSFSFYYSCASEATSASAITDTLEVDYSLTCGKTWSRFGFFAGQ
jgi:PKD repeat protein